jgi:hypothetical protein
VPTTQPFFRFIEAFARAGITGGCGPGLFCPGANVSPPGDGDVHGGRAGTALPELDPVDVSKAPAARGGCLLRGVQRDLRSVRVPTVSTSLSPIPPHRPGA